MNSFDFLQIIIFFTMLFILSPFLGIYIAKIFTGKKTILNTFLEPIELIIYKLSGIDPTEEMDWKQYIAALLIFNFIGIIALFLILFYQNSFPFNPQSYKGISWHLALNTAISFVTNTNWQSYSGESTLSYFSQMTGLTVQNFLSAATGIAVLIALIRGIMNRGTNKLGNFWVILTKTTLYILLPLALIVAIILSSQGVVQSLSDYVSFNTIEGEKQIIPLGPVASQTAIKLLGTNGGGFFGVNSAHPFENSTPFSNFIQMLSLIIIPVALLFTFGKMIGSQKQALAIFAAMLILLVIGLAIMLCYEYKVNPITGIKGSLEGKELRFGITNSILWSELTTATSCGAVNSMHDSLSPIAGMMTMFNLMLSEVKFGGVGAGLYGMLLFVIIAVFISGLMVGRTPEYLGKKIEKKEVQMAMLGIIAPSFVILIFTAIASVTQPGLTSLGNNGPHGLSQILYAFSSAAANNGSAFAGLGTNTVFYNTLLSIGMLIGRFAIIVPILVIAGSMSEKKFIAESLGTFRTDSILFTVILLIIVIIVVALNFLPALCLGPIVEHLLMLKEVTF